MSRSITQNKPRVKNLNPGGQATKDKYEDKELRASIVGKYATGAYSFTILSRIYKLTSTRIGQIIAKAVEEGEVPEDFMERVKQLRKGTLNV